MAWQHACSMKKLSLGLFASVLACNLPLAQAELVGLDPDPLGSHSDAGVGYAYWDSFPSVTFADAAPGESDSDVFSAALISTMAGGMLLTSGDTTGNRIYAGTNTGTTNPFEFSLTATAVQDIGAAVLQLKTTASLDALTVSLNGLSGTATTVATGIVNSTGSTTYSDFSWTWTGLDIEFGDTFSFAISSTAGHNVLDVVALDASVASVPEPETWLLLAAGMGFLLIINRRRFSRRQFRN